PGYLLRFSTRVGERRGRGRAHGRLLPRSRRRSRPGRGGRRPVQPWCRFRCGPVRPRGGFPALSPDGPSFSGAGTVPSGRMPSRNSTVAAGLDGGVAADDGALGGYDGPEVLV